MKLKKRKISKVWKEVLDTIEAFKDNPDYAPDPDHVQIYITTKLKDKILRSTLDGFFK